MSARQSFGLLTRIAIFERKPAGFGFVKYRNAEDAAEAKHHMNNQIICGHQISVVFSKEDAKRPEQMLAKEHNT
ncbi:hypothetical protein SUGI_1107750 [Cryptomeria japonica]|nr:hypothetical protein SUGI_1107750 [Cryptomeria japonica]